MDFIDFIDFMDFIDINFRKLYYSKYLDDFLYFEN